MWVIRRKVDKFVIVWAYRKRDLPSLEKVRGESGFVNFDDELEIAKEDE